MTLILPLNNSLRKKPNGNAERLKPSVKKDLLAATLCNRLNWRDLTGDNSVTADVTGTATPVITNYGRGISYAAGSNYQKLLPAADVGTKNHTLFLVRSVNDTIKRVSAAFGTSTGVAVERFSANMPWTDSKVYYDYGGTGGNNRLIWTGYSKVPGAIEIWTFRGGDSGVQLWYNGVLQESKTVAVSRTNIGDFCINNGSVAGDNQTVYAVYLFGVELPNSVIRAYCADLYRRTLANRNGAIYYPAVVDSNVINPYYNNLIGGY